MYVITEKRSLDYLCILITKFDQGDDYNMTEYEYSSTDLEDATKFVYKKDAQEFLRHYRFAADYKIIKIK